MYSGSPPDKTGSAESAAYTLFLRRTSLHRAADPAFLDFKHSRADILVDDGHKFRGLGSTRTRWKYAGADPC